MFVCACVIIVDNLCYMYSIRDIGTVRLSLLLDSSISSPTGSLVRPKVIKSVHYCPATKKTIERKYSDLTSLDPFPTSGVYPTKVQLHV